jgi:Leucine-rich repeat (LRR) protein
VKDAAEEPNDLRIEASSIFFIPKDFFVKYKMLKIFVAVNCSIREIYYDTFTSAHKLHYLVLSHNRIALIPDDAFARNSDLQSLKLDHNAIEFLTAKVFRGLGALRSLKLCYNKIEYLPLFVFADLESLETLELAGNRIRILSAEQFASNKQLTQIDLGGNRVIIVDNGTFDGLMNLRQLNFDNNLCVNESFSDRRVEEITETLKHCTTSAHFVDREVSAVESRVLSVTATILLILSIIVGLSSLTIVFYRKRMDGIFYKKNASNDHFELVNHMTESSYQVL